MSLDKIDIEFCLENFRATIVENSYLCQCGVDVWFVRTIYLKRVPDMERLNVLNNLGDEARISGISGLVTV